MPAEERRKLVVSHCACEVIARTPLLKLNGFSPAALAASQAVVLAATLQAGAAFAGPPDTPAIGKPSPLIAAMQTELERSFKVLGGQEPPAYFIGYTITDTQRAEVSGSNGALLSSGEARNRWRQASVRTGSYTLDNTHKVGEQRMPNGGPGTGIPVDDDSEVVRRAIWLETDNQYRTAAEALIKIRSSKEVKEDTAEGHAPDFSHEQPHKSIEPEASFTLDRKPWEEKVRAYTKTFRESPDILNSIVTFSG